MALLFVLTFNNNVAAAFLNIKPVSNYIFLKCALSSEVTSETLLYDEPSNEIRICANPIILGLHITFSLYLILNLLEIKTTKTI